MERGGAFIIPVVKEISMFVEKECFGFGLGKILQDNDFTDEQWEIADLLLLVYIREQCKSCDHFDNCLDFIFTGLDEA